VEVFDNSFFHHYAEIAGGLSTDDRKRGGVSNLVDGASVASLFKEAGTERGSFLCNPQNLCILIDLMGRTTALFTKQEHGNCAFCLGKHAHEKKRNVRILFLNLLDVLYV